MSELSVSLGQVRAEQKSFWRNPTAAFFGFAFPLMFLLIFGTIFKGQTVCVDGYYNNRGQCVGGGVQVPYNTFFVPTMAAWGVLTTCYVNLAMSVTNRRDAGLLKRLRGTPLPPAAYVVGVVGSALITALITVALTELVGHYLYSAPWPAHWLQSLVIVLLGGAVFCALAMAVTVLIPNADAAIAVVNISYLPLLFISGFFFSFNDTVLNDIAKVFPIYWFKEAMLTAFGARLSVSGWDGGDLLVLLAWGVVGLAIALRFFRWMPRRA
ncbi:MAG TPA: ABC transporter permease [Candidatus Binatia bacterium]|nr:ABC transporter permease [Candidatus Binatia bacterium]